MLPMAVTVALHVRMRSLQNNINVAEYTLPNIAVESRTMYLPTPILYYDVAHSSVVYNILHVHVSYRAVI